MLHITDGESVAGTLRETAIPGEVSTYGDLMYEGPTPAGLDAESWRDVRARFIADAGYATLQEADRYLKACHDTLVAFSRHDEVVVWLDHRLSDQLILIKALDWFSRQDRGDTKLSLICVQSGLGQLTADQLASLADTRLRVTDTQFRVARAAWDAFTSPDPTAIERFLATDTLPLPYLAPALWRHLEQFPSVENGLSRTERQALSILREQGPLSRKRLFVATQRLEEQVFMGDASFYRIMAGLSNVKHPLVRTTGPSTLTLTETGRTVLEGGANHIKLNGIDRWLGGVHLVVV